MIKYLLLLSIIIFAVIFGSKFSGGLSENFYSQIGQDKHVLDFFDGHKGYFLDVGATNGIDISNTYELEKQGWKGICVEPQKKYYDQLVKNRVAICSNYLLYDKEGQEVDFNVANELAGITNDIGSTHYNSVKNTPIIKLKTNTLNNLLTENNAPNNIDFLSLDTEGSELPILKGCDLNKYRFGFMAIEHNSEEPRKTELKNYLLENDYLYKCDNAQDYYFIDKNILEGSYKYKKDIIDINIKNENDKLYCYDNNNNKIGNIKIDINNIILHHNKYGDLEMKYNKLIKNNKIWRRKYIKK